MPSENFWHSWILLVPKQYLLNPLVLFDRLVGFSKILPLCTERKRLNSCKTSQNLSKKYFNRSIIFDFSKEQIFIINDFQIKILNCFSWTRFPVPVYCYFPVFSKMRKKPFQKLFVCNIPFCNPYTPTIPIKSFYSFFSLFKFNLFQNHRLDFFNHGLNQQFWTCTNLSIISIEGLVPRTAFCYSENSEKITYVNLSIFEINFSTPKLKAIFLSSMSVRQFLCPNDIFFYVEDRAIMKHAVLPSMHRKTHRLKPLKIADINDFPTNSNPFFFGTSAFHLSGSH